VNQILLIYFAVALSKAPSELAEPSTTPGAAPAPAAVCATRKVGTPDCALTNWATAAPNLPGTATTATAEPAAAPRHAADAAAGDGREDAEAAGIIARHLRHVFVPLARHAAAFFDVGGPDAHRVRERQHRGGDAAFIHVI